MDAARALIVARLDQTGQNMAEVSKAIGKSHSYLQQFLRRGIPRVLPEDVREALAFQLQVSPDALRGGLPGKGGPKPVAAEGIAATDAELVILRAFRALTPDGQRRAIQIVPTLG
jgi:lambda repressor-like predicted transcriptional regulator